VVVVDGDGSCGGNTESESEGGVREKGKEHTDLLEKLLHLRRRKDLAVTLEVLSNRVAGVPGYVRVHCVCSAEGKKESDSKERADESMPKHGGKTRSGLKHEVEER
jgi:hypothetical protein